MKKIILIILLFVPIFTNAICDETIRNEGKNLVKHVTEEVSYNKSSNKFSLTLNNIQDGMKIEYLDNFYYAQNEKVVISDLREGTSVRVKIYYNDGCDDPIDIIIKQIPYYNRYYKSYLCNEYDNKFYECSAQFTTYYVTEELVMLAIDNYESKGIPIKKEEVKEEEVIEKTVKEKVKEFTEKWVIKIVLVVLSTVLSIVIGKSKYIKEVHGV